MAGEVLAVRSRWLWILLALTLLYLVGLARSLERRQLRRQIGEPYAAYERAVPRWIPRLGGK